MNDFSAEQNSYNLTADVDGQKKFQNSHGCKETIKYHVSDNATE